MLDESWLEPAQRQYVFWWGNQVVQSFVPFLDLCCVKSSLQDQINNLSLNDLYFVITEASCPNRELWMGCWWLLKGNTRWSKQRWRLCILRMRQQLETGTRCWSPVHPLSPSIHLLLSRYTYCRCPVIRWYLRWSKCHLNSNTSQCGPSHKWSRSIYFSIQSFLLVRCIFLFYLYLSVEKITPYLNPNTQDLHNTLFNEVITIIPHPFNLLQTEWYNPEELLWLSFMYLCLPVETDFLPDI